MIGCLLGLSTGLLDFTFKDPQMDVIYWKGMSGRRENVGFYFYNGEHQVLSSTPAMLGLVFDEAVEVIFDYLSGNRDL